MNRSRLLIGENKILDALQIAAKAFAEDAGNAKAKWEMQV